MRRRATEDIPKTARGPGAAQQQQQHQLSSVSESPWEL